MYDLGIALTEKTPGCSIVSAVLWHTNRRPAIPLRKVSITAAKDRFISTIIVVHETPIRAINAACYRAIEQLILQRRVPPGTKPSIKLFMRTDKYAKNMLIPPSNDKGHALIKVASKVLREWIKGLEQCYTPTKMSAPMSTPISVENAVNHLLRETE